MLYRIFVRTIGNARANVNVTLMNLTYNLSCIEVLIRNKVIGIDRVGPPKICPAVREGAEEAEKSSNCAWETMQTGKMRWKFEKMKMRRSCQECPVSKRDL